MTKPLLYSLGVLGINVVVSFAMALAFLLFLFRGDPILAAVPALFAAPAILLQPWCIAFFFIAKGLFLAPILTTAVTVTVYGLLNRGGMLERPKKVLSRFKVRKTLIGIGGFFLFIVGVAFARYIDFPALHQGLPPSVGSSNWSLTDSQYYCLGQFIDSQWLWRAHLSESDLADFTQRYRLHPINSNQVPNEFREQPPYWWRPTITERTQVLSTPIFPMDERGPDGWHALATWNPDDQVLYVWIKDNF
jgi:hypothetical protein